MFWHVSVCPQGHSHSQVQTGGTSARSRRGGGGGGYPSHVPDRGSPPGRRYLRWRVPPGRDGVPLRPGPGQGGYPRWGTPWPGQHGGYLRWGTPPAGMGVPSPGQVRTVRVPKVGYPIAGMGYPLARSGWGVPEVEYALSGMGVPPPPYMTADGVLDTPRSVCLLCSRRRTFLLSYGYCNTNRWKAERKYKRIRLVQH